MAMSFRKDPHKIAATCLAFLASIIVVAILAIIMFASDPIGTARECYIFLKTKIAGK